MLHANHTFLYTYGANIAICSFSFVIVSQTACRVEANCGGGGGGGGGGGCGGGGGVRPACGRPPWLRAAVSGALRVRRSPRQRPLPDHLGKPPPIPHPVIAISRYLPYGHHHRTDSDSAANHSLHKHHSGHYLQAHQAYTCVS